MRLNGTKESNVPFWREALVLCRTVAPMSSAVTSVKILVIISLDLKLAYKRRGSRRESLIHRVSP